MLGFYLKMPSWVEGKLSTTRSQNSGFQLLVFGGGGGWCILQESWVQPWRNVWLLWILLFFSWVAFRQARAMSSYSRFSPTEADVEGQAEDWCAQPPPKSQVRVLISISGSSAPHVKYPQLHLARRTSRQAVARVILLRGVLVTQDPGHLSRILKP